MAGTVRRWPDGLEAWSGEPGTTLSCGECQWLALARVLLTDCPVVVLDEPASQVDPQATSVVMQAVRRLADTRAVLLITHRLGNPGIADEIAVLASGRMVERGGFETLAARKGGQFRARLTGERGEWTVSESNKAREASG